MNTDADSFNDEQNERLMRCDVCGTTSSDLVLDLWPGGDIRGCCCGRCILFVEKHFEAEET